MKCKQVLPLLSSYIDEELSAEDKEQIEIHLQKCDTCPKVLAQLQEAIDCMKGIPQVAVPSELEERIRAGIRAEEQAKEAGSSTEQPRHTTSIRNALRYVLVFSGVLAAVIAVIIPLRAYWLFSDSPKTTSKKVESFDVQEETELSGERKDKNEAVGKVKPAPSAGSAPVGDRVKESSVDYNDKGVDRVWDSFKEQEGEEDWEFFSAETRDEVIAAMLIEAEQRHLNANELEKCLDTLLAQSQTVLPVQAEKATFEDRDAWIIVLEQFSPHQDKVEIEVHAIDTETHKILYSKK